MHRDRRFDASDREEKSNTKARLNPGGLSGMMFGSLAEVGGYNPLEESERVSDAQAAAHLRCEVLNKGEMVAIKPIAKIEGIERDDMRRMLPRYQVRS